MKDLNPQSDDRCKVTVFFLFGASTETIVISQLRKAFVRSTQDVSLECSLRD
jgi:hypothetical protein